MPQFSYANGRALQDGVGVGKAQNEHQTPYIQVQIQVLNSDGSNADIVPWRGTISPEFIGSTIEQLRLLGARCADDDFGDLDGLGSKVANLKIEEHEKYGRSVRYINPPGRGIRQESRVGGADLDALRASMKKYAQAARSSVKAPQPSAAPPWRPSVPASPPQVQQNPAADVDPWNEPGAYEGVDQPSQAPQQVYAPPAGYGPPQQAAVGGPPRRAPF